MNPSDRTQDVLSGGFEEVTFLEDPASSLRAIVVLHDTSLGPALGGIRCRPYASVRDALADAQNLALGMTRKCALAGLSAGGGKVVILESGDLNRTLAFQAIGRKLDEYRGRFFTSRDLGTSEADLRTVSQVTKHVSTASGMSAKDLDLATAEGVFVAIGTCLEILGIAEWSGVRIAIQGLGEVGLNLATKAAKIGAEVIGCDVDGERINRAEDTLPLRVVDPDEIYSQPCEVFAPCAVGGTLNPTTISRLRCRMVAGAANNQLQDSSCGDELARLGIFYAPDYVVNCGAVIRGCPSVCVPQNEQRDLQVIGRRIRQIGVESLTSGEATQRIADRKADAVWMKARQQRTGERAAAVELKTAP